MNQMVEARQYWTDRVRSLPVILSPFWSGPPTNSPLSFEYELSSSTAHQLEALTRGAPLLRHAAIVAAVEIALARHCRVSNVVVGSAPRADTADRPSPNVLPIVASLGNDLSFGALLSQTRQSLLDAFAVQISPCLPVIEEFHPESSPIKVAVELEGFTGPLATVPEVLVSAEVDPHRATLRMRGQPGLAPESLRTFGTHVERVLEAGLQNYSIRVHDIELLTSEEYRLIVHEWSSHGNGDYAESVVDQFELHAARQPNAPVFAGAAECTYGELNARANRLAHRLRAVGVGREVRVGVFLGRAEQIITATLAVLKAGGAYIPFDVSYPRARVAAMLDDAAPSAIVTDTETVADLPATEALVVRTDDELADGGESGNLGVSADSAQLAYVTYTSGSTGEPKGVMVTHGSLSNAIATFAEYGKIGAGSRISQISSFGFDASALECYLALTRGATLCIAPPSARASGAELSAFLRATKVTTIGAITPSVLALIDPADVGDVDTIHIGAEKCPAKLADRWSAGRLLLNCYGPTEATVDCICGPCQPGEGDPPLGKPIPGARAYVLDGHGRPVPVGIVGELYVGGVPVARGYAQRPAATALAFVPDPFGAEPGGRLYRTGDLARFRPDGRLDFCGRVDRQVKVDGVRIEIGEIESMLRTHPQVSQAAVEVEGDVSDQRKLVAYVVFDGQSVPAGTLRKHLSRVLPPTMLPSAFVELEKLPLTENGKIDRRRLPAPEEEGGSSAPDGLDSEIERTLAAIWSEVLGVDSVRPEDDFFELGGRSLQVTRVASKLAKALSVQLPLETMFESSTLGGLAEVVAGALGDQSGTEEPSAPQPVPRTSALPLSFSQRRLWFLDQVLPPDAAGLYNGPVPVRLQGTLHLDALQRSFDEIIRRHEVLRTAFRVTDGQPCQVILPELSVPIDSITLTGNTEEKLAQADALADADARQPFDLTTPPLLRIRLLTLDPTDNLLLVNIHHIVFDGWSVGVLLNELARLYEAFIRDAESPLPPLPLQYVDFAVWQRRTLEDGLEDQLSYWRQQLAGAADLELPTDRDRPAEPTYRGDIFSFHVSRSRTDEITELGHASGATLFMTLLAAFDALLHRYTAQEDIVISSPVANRTYAELENLIGFFVNSLVLRTDLSGNPSFRELLERVRVDTLGAYDHQDVPFERLVEELRPERVATHNPLFRAAFSLQNTPSSPAALPGLDVVPWDTHGRTAKFDLVVALTETSDGLAGDIEYSSDLFDPQTIQTMAELYCDLLDSIVHDPEKTVLELPLRGTARPATSAVPVPAFSFGERPNQQRIETD